MVTHNHVAGGSARTTKAARTDCHTQKHMYTVMLGSAGDRATVLHCHLKEPNMHLRWETLK